METVFLQYWVSSRLNEDSSERQKFSYVMGRESEKYLAVKCLRTSKSIDIFIKSLCELA